MFLFQGSLVTCLYVHADFYRWALYPTYCSVSEDIGRMNEVIKLNFVSSEKVRVRIWDAERYFTARAPLRLHPKILIL